MHYNKIIMSKEAFITVKDVTKVYGDVAVVDKVSFSINSGSVTTILGPNGAGKSTLAKMMMGLVSPTRGTISINKKTPHKMRTTIGYVPQSFVFNSKIPITVSEFMKLSLHIIGKHEREKDEVIKKRFKDVGLTNVMNKKLYQLSGGQLQRVLIARALLTDKTLLILDEPVAGIDIEGRKSIYELLKDLNKNHNMTIVIISHELDVVFSYSDQVLCINRRLLCHGKPQETLTEDVIKKIYGVHHHAHYHHHCSNHS
ncbi:ATP-binding cassette domain-containing protein [Candidatus Peregrinibacteria bacterium]|nr:ATP-binding cassette domain-containing protein [Candidatus Peregrinibacteria bacterium]